jgi:hypothetical protein
MDLSIILNWDQPRDPGLVPCPGETSGLDAHFTQDAGRPQLSRLFIPAEPFNKIDRRRLLSPDWPRYDCDYPQGEARQGDLSRRTIRRVEQGDKPGARESLLGRDNRARRCFFATWFAGCDRCNRFGVVTSMAAWAAVLLATIRERD